MHHLHTLNLALVRQQHSNWQDSLTAYLSGNVPLEPAQMLAHTQCDLGRWLLALDTDVLAGNSLLLSIAQAHACLHEIAHAVSQPDSFDQQRDPRELLPLVPQVTQRFFDLLDEVNGAGVLMLNTRLIAHLRTIRSLSAN